MPAGEINGTGLGIAAAGAVLIWAGIHSVSPFQAFRQLAMGQAPEVPPKSPFQPVQFQGGTSGGMVTPVAASGSAVLAMAEQVARSPAGRANYCWGGGHTSSPCSARCFDCSGYVSCVLNRLGVLKGSMTTVGFLAWKGAVTVPWDQRQPGDLVVNARHMGIAIDGSRMWNAACTACGPVKVSPYGRSYTIRRIRGVPAGGSGGGSRPVVV